MTNKEGIRFIKDVPVTLEDILTEQRKLKVKKIVTKIMMSFIRAVLIFGLMFVILFPIFQQFSLAIRDPIDINNPTVIWIPENFSSLTLKVASLVLNYRESLLGSLRISFVTMVFQIFVTSLAGYAFARLRFRGSNIIFLLVLATIMIPPQTLSMSRYLNFRFFDVFGIIQAIRGEPLNLLNSRWSLYLMTAFGQGIQSGIFIYIFRQFFRNIPMELEESAEVDGASVLRTYWSIMLPNVRSGILVVGLFAFVWQYNDVYFTSLLQVDQDIELLSNNLKNAMVFIPNALFMSGADHLVSKDVDQNPFYTALVANTCAFLVMLPLLVLYIIVQKYFVQGVERSGLVG